MGTLSTHVLDTSLGSPAAGITVVLESAEGQAIGDGITDGDGRVGSIGPERLDAGDYRLRFASGGYFAGRGVDAFYPEVVVVFTIADADQHYHVPVLLNPFGYSTYRGVVTMGAAQRMVLDGCTVATMDPARTEHAVGHVVIDGSRIVAVGAGRYVDDGSAAVVIDGTGCLATPGLVNTHHHLYQWATRGLAVDATLFGWLTELYPVWGGIDEDVVGAAAAAGLGWLARTGCTTSMDHHYVFPAHGGDVLGAEIEAARRIGLRFLATRGSMDLGQSKGGLPPDHVVEDLDTILAATAAAVDAHHDGSPDSMLRIGVAPCSPFSVTADLLRESAALARDRGVRLHTHLAETTDEERYCAERFDLTPLGYMESLGWVGDDVWLAHGIHFDDVAIKALATSGTGVAHCPSSNARLGAGIARTRDLRDAGVPVGLGVDGAASNEASSLVEEARHALLFARARGGPEALGVRDALELATIGGARVLGWDDQIGSLEVGKLADVALWRLDGLGHAGIVDPVAALVLGSQPPLELLLVGGRPVVEDDRLVTADETSLAAQAVSAGERLLDRHRGSGGYISASR